MIGDVHGDFQRIVDELNALYEAGDEPYKLKALRPVLKLEKEVIFGEPISTCGFHVFKPIPHEKLALAVDASLKVLFDCGAFKVMLAKVSRSAWRGKRRLSFYEPIKRAKVVWSRVEAVEFLIDVELDAVLNSLDLLNEGSLCLLDRPLMLFPRYSERIKLKLKNFAKSLERSGVALVGISKSSQLKLNTGEPLVGYLSYLSRRLGLSAPWSYMPIFNWGFEKWYLGTPTITKFSDSSSYAFRVDVLAEDELQVLSYLAYLQDDATPGYPYPVKLAHDEAKVCDQEIIHDRRALLEVLAEAGVLDRFLSSVRSSSFKEEFLWRRASR